jgi:hypothetical protein
MAQKDASHYGKQRSCAPEGSEMNAASYLIVMACAGGLLFGRRGRQYSDLIYDSPTAGAGTAAARVKERVLPPL